MTFSLKPLAAILLSSFVCLSFAQTTTLPDLTKTVNQVKQGLPKQLSMDLLLTDINYDHQKQILIYTATLANPQRITNKTEQDKVVNEICYNPTLRSAISQGITVSFFYYGINKDLLKNIVITESSCELNFKQFESKLNKELKQLKTTLPQPLNSQFTAFNIDYDTDQKIISIDAKANKDSININNITKEDNVNLVCNHPYFSELTEKYISFHLKYYAEDEKKLIKDFSVDIRDCQKPIGEEMVTGDDLDKQLAEEAKTIKQNLNTFSNNTIQLFDVGYNPQQRTIWNKAIIKQPNITSAQINPNMSVAGLCNNPTTRQTINKGVTYQYSYYDTNNNLLTSFAIDKETCRSFDQTANILLQK